MYHIFDVLANLGLVSSCCCSLYWEGTARQVDYNRVMGQAVQCLTQAIWTAMYNQGVGYVCPC